MVNSQGSLVRGQGDEKTREAGCKSGARADARSEHRYRDLCANIPGMVYRSKADWSVQFLSNAEVICGARAEALASGALNWRDIVHPDDLADLRHVAKTLEAGPASLTQVYRIVAADGTIRWVSDHKSSRFDANGAFDGVDGVVLDVTVQKQAEAALRDSEQRHRALFEGATTGILVADVETHKFVSANPAICDLLGYSVEELTRMEVPRIHPEESRPAVIAAFEEMARGELRTAPDLPCLRKNGDIVYASISMAHIEFGGKLCLMGFFSDLTERKRAEDERRELEKQLYEEQKLAAVGTLACGMGHEINNPIMGIINYAQLIKDHLQGKDESPDHLT